ncbi:MAG: adenosine kinase [Proteobacteria bacterium]|nr:adenosine kinase [Pseudomonadota bacterium]
MKNFDVVGLGNPLVDIIIRSKDDILKELNIPKGSMNLVDVKRQTEIIDKNFDQKSTIALGGSCANTMVMISQLGGRSGYNGKVGTDKYSRVFENELIAAGTATFLKNQKGATGSTVILVTPDAERSMNTHLGMCLEFSSEDVDLKAIAETNYLYVEGYLWDTPVQKKAVKCALEYAKKVGTKISLTLSDSFCVERHKEQFISLTRDYVDLLFCNDTEAELITGEKDVEKQIKILSTLVDHIVLTMGKRGSVVYVNNKITTFKAFDVNAVDTTGAGDSFAAGYLYAVNRAYSTQDAGNLASYCAAIVVSQVGPRYRGDFKSKVQPYLKN